jgi:FAD/FMN-containing dehydrogenase
MPEPDASVIDQLRELLGESAVRDEPDNFMPDVILKPETTEQVCGILKICSAAAQTLVPLGGKTGLANGHHQTDNEIGLSLERMNAIEEVDEINRTMTLQAGCILQVAQEAAEDKGLLLPLDFGARGSATIGGTVATNAGGNMVIRYGMMRETVLGMEVVLADGSVISNMNKMLKNNTGYDLKQMFIGAEGTLGVITRLVLRLRPKPRTQNTALLAVDDFASVSSLLHWLDTHTAGTLSAFEVMWPEFYEYITREGSNHAPPLPHGSPYYVLVETLGSDPDRDSDDFERVLTEVFEQGLASNAVLPKSQRERNAVWEIRDEVLDLFHLGPLIPFDISITIDRMEDFVADLRAQMDRIEDSFCIVFGHIGDCNLHVVLGNRSSDKFDHHALEELLYATVQRFRGAVSAEHGIGLAKREYLSCSRSEAELQLMASLKNMLDPQNILNPGKIIPAERIAAARTIEQ